MNPHDEKELEREEGRDLLDRLTLLTKKRRLSWDCVTYQPLDIDEDPDNDLPESTFLNHSFTARTESGGAKYRAVVHEWVTLDGTGGMDLDLEITTDALEKNARYYKTFSHKSIAAFIDALLSVIVGSDEEEAMIAKSQSPSKYADAKLHKNPIVRLGDKLFYERRIKDFHRAVCHPATLKKLLSEIT